MDIKNYIKSLDFNAICYKLAQYEIGDKLHAGNTNIKNEINKAGGKQNYLDNVAQYYINTFHIKKSALQFFKNKQSTSIETFLLEFYCAY